MSITSWNSTRFSKFFNARLSRKFATKLLLHLILNLKNVASLHYAVSNRNVSKVALLNDEQIENERAGFKFNVLLL